MKYLFLTFIIGGGLSLPAQTDSLGFLINFYFEDAVGNKDTVYVGGIEGAHPNFNPEHGEVNLLNEPFDSVFEARAGKYDELLFDRLSPTYIGKTIISNILFENPAVPRSCRTQRIRSISFIVNSIHPPVTISWDNSEEIFDNPYLHCRPATLIANSYVHEFGSEWWNDSGPGWIDYTCLRNDQPKEFFPWDYPSGRDEAFSTFYPFSVNGSLNEKDTLPVFPLIWQQEWQIPCSRTVSNEAPENGTEGLLNVFPNPVRGYLHLKNHSEGPIAIFSLAGREALSFSTPQEVIDVSNLPPGIYFLRQTGDDGRIITRKFIKQPF